MAEMFEVVGEVQAVILPDDVQLIHVPIDEPLFAICKVDRYGTRQMWLCGTEFDALRMANERNAELGGEPTRYVVQIATRGEDD